MSAELNKSDWVCDLVFLDAAPDHRGPLQLDDEPVPDPIGEHLQKLRFQEVMRKDSTPEFDPAWNEPVGIAPRVELSKAFLEQSDERLARVEEKIRAFFGIEHEEEAEEAIQLAKDMRDAVRQEF